MLSRAKNKMMMVKYMPTLVRQRALQS